MPQRSSIVSPAWRQHFAYFAAWAALGLIVALSVLLWRALAPAAPAASSPPARSYSAAVLGAGPSVVNIYANRIVTEQAVRPLENNPAAQRFLGLRFTPVGPPRQRIEESLGSAVIVREDGYLLTNHHVVQNKDNIRAVLWDGRTADARVVATDPETDLAVLKIDVDGLPAIRFAAENSLRIGDVVLAIGNPFGLGQSVSMGIVSALGAERVNLGLASQELASNQLAAYEYLIQTDAAVNTGNSGGALVNAEGELVGVNTAMFGRGRGAEGISFAIPAETARLVLADIIRQGYVTRGWLGVAVAPVLMEHTTSGERRVGLQIQALARGGPAEIAGLQLGDILMRIDDTILTSLAQFRRTEAALAPDSRVRIEAIRAGLPFVVETGVAQAPRAQP
jgi:serine protease DegS/serine protease DegQ